MKSRAPESYRVTHTLTIADYVIEYDGDDENDWDDWLYANVDIAEVYAKCSDRIMRTIEERVSGDGSTWGEIDIDLEEEGVDIGLPDCVLRVEWSIDFDSITEW